jgi:hypothetical protein
MRSHLVNTSSATTGLSRGRILLALVVVLITLSACGSAIESDAAAQIVDDPFTSLSPLEASILGDGVVTDEEMSRLFDSLLECFQTQGLEVMDSNFRHGGWSYELRLESDAAEQAAAACEADLSPVADLYLASVRASGPDLQSVLRLRAEAMRACLTERGYTDLPGADRSRAYMTLVEPLDFEFCLDASSRGG